MPRLAEKYGFSQAYIFGSLAKKGRFHKNSDIDLAVSGLSDEYLFRFGAELSECMGREVDVLQVEQLKKRPHLNQRILEAAIEWKKKS
ncbi:MAG: nucleotidyltransferase domain-containing protein [Planctomycetes bacterium]|nr:nucleotidyltransferase domain-containing protein [Planctomycetota bacterium]